MTKPQAQAKQANQSTTSSQQPQKANRKKNKNGRRPRPIKIRNADGSTTVVIADCTRDYALANSDPFIVQSLPCVPDQTVLPSYKFRCFARGTLAAGTSGIGFVAINPWAPFNDSVASGAPFATITVTPSVGTSSTKIASFTGTVSIDPVSPVSYAAYNGAIAGAAKLRCVGIAVRISDATSIFYSAGRVFISRHPTNGPWGQYTPLQVQTLPDTVYTANKKGDVYTSNWKAMSTEAFQYQYASGSLGGPPADSQFGIVILGQDVSASWEWEVVGFYESVGSATAGSSVSHADPVGLSKTLQVLQTPGFVGTVKMPTPYKHREGIFEEIGHAIADGTSSVVGGLAKGVGGLLSNPQNLLTAGRAAMSLM